MTDTTVAPVSLFQLRHGDSFTFRGKDYVLVEHKRAKSSIASIADGKISIYNLSVSAKVVKTGRDEAGYRLALAELYPTISFKPGDAVRIVDNERTRSRKIAGMESTVIRVNSKTVSLANGWRITPAALEAV